MNSPYSSLSRRSKRPSRRATNLFLAIWQIEGGISAFEIDS